MTTKNIFTHDAYETDSRNNHFVSQTTPSNINTIFEVTISKYIVPIIFIPGIMGSNLFNGKAKAWFPPNKKRLTAVLANSPGALQLLPFGNFRDKGRTDWITIQSKAQTVKIPITNDNPYDSIYKKQGVWWEMINPKLIDPAGNYTEYLKRKLTASISEVYHFNIDILKKFHTKIADSYHPNSYTHYAADDSHKANGEIIWTDDESAEELKLSSNLDLIMLGSNIQGGNEGKPITYSMNKSQYSNDIDSQREVIYQTNPEKKQFLS